jgi:hypothetical protein
MSRGTIEIRIGGKSYRVTKEATAKASEVGGLAEQWSKEGMGNFLAPAADMLQDWPSLRRSPKPIF